METARKPAARRRREGLWHTAGMLFYEMGYQAEYAFVRLFRLAKMLLGSFGLLWLMMLRLVRGNVRPFLMSLGNDLLSPFRQAVSGFRNIAAVIRAERETGGSAVKAGTSYFVRGLRVYSGLIRRSLSYLFPIGAAAVFGVVVWSVLGQNYALAVEYRGELVGYIASETVYEQARQYVEGRIRNTGTEEEWSVTPTFTISAVPAAAMRSVTELADRLIETSDEQIQSASGVIVDGLLIGVTSDSESLQQELSAVKAPYEDSSNPNLRVEFWQDVEVVDGLYFTSTIEPLSELLSKLRGETPVTLDDGTQVSVNMLRVKQVVRETVSETLEYEEQIVEDETLTWGKREIVQEGVDGSRDAVYDVTYMDGVEMAREFVEEQNVIEPVNEIMVIGTQTITGSAGATGTGVFMWPVPDYSYQSRGFMGTYHRGLDICGAYGTYIYAADNGVVEFAGSDPNGYNWSYGNYVKIDHGNGYSTIYAHCSDLAVTTGQYVTKGTIIAYMGSTGRSSGNHCHFEILYNGQLCDPANFVTAPAR